MEITLIHGQMHKGSTYHIAASLKEKLADKDTTVHEFFLPKDGPTFCVGCFQCILKGETYCQETVKVQKIKEAMLRSKVIVVDSPTYCFEMTGQLKTLFDHFAYQWMSHRPEGEMFGKIGVVVSTSAGAGEKNVTKSIRRQLFWWGIPRVHKLSFKVVASSWEDVSEKVRRKIEKEVDDTALRIKAEAKSVKPKLKTKAIFNVMRKMQQSNTWNMLDKEHWQRNQWIGKARPW